MDMVFPAERTHFLPGAHKIGAAIFGPRIADKNYTDTRIFRTFRMKNMLQTFPEVFGPLLYGVPQIRGKPKGNN